MADVVFSLYPLNLQAGTGFGENSAWQGDTSIMPSDLLREWQDTVSLVLLYGHGEAFITSHQPCSPSAAGRHNCNCFCFCL